ncbi:MAG: hypothetical protein ACO1SX_02035 [Actinomycetota bacterium]
MYQRLGLGVLAGLTVAALWISTPQAASQLVDKKQALVIGYPNPGIVISDAVPVYKGLIYVKVYAVGPGGVVAANASPVVSAELSPSQRTVNQLPPGEYEVHFAIRKGSELTTLIHRNVVLRTDYPANLVVEMNADAKTTIIGGDWTAQRMTESIKALQAEAAALKKELAELKRK